MNERSERRVGQCGEVRVAVAIPTYNRDQVLIATIKQVFGQDPPADELIVIDQSEAHTRQVEVRLQKYDRQGAIRYIRLSPPNLPAARNVALQTTTCDVVIFIDDDVELCDGFVAKHRANYQRDSDLVAVGGKVRSLIPRRRQRCRGGWRRVLDFRCFELDSDVAMAGIATFPGGNHSVRVAEVVKVGGYDAWFRGVAHREESDLALRLFLMGRRIIFDPHAWLLHLEAPAGGCRRKSLFDMSGARSAVYFAFKHRKALGLSVVLGEIWGGTRTALLNRFILRRLPVFPFLAAHWCVEVLRAAFAARSGGTAERYMPRGVGRRH